MHKIPIIDLFAGPGGLGEGFSQFSNFGIKAFKIALSIETDRNAHETLKLRSFFRQFKTIDVPQAYYRFIRGEISKDKLYLAYPEEHNFADKEAWHETLGEVDESELDNRLTNALGEQNKWILIGGPPCQAYSTVGRSRNKGISSYVPENDKRHFLYKQYLRIIASHWPAIFIMENVRGILSSKIKGKSIFPEILKDLRDPADIFNGRYSGTKYRYKIFSLAKRPDFFSIDGDPIYKNINDYTIKCEDYGVPQARHRVILLGVREDFYDDRYPILQKKQHVPVHKVLGHLPRLRSGFSRGEDNKQKWFDWIDQIINEDWYKRLQNNVNYNDVAERIFNENLDLRHPQKERGGEFIQCNVKTRYLSDWFVDKQLGGICNSTTRGHIERDLYRYFFAACFAKEREQSPVLGDFPEELLPNHKNARTAKKEMFSDRFRVQMASKPSTTIMSHISKDGHYYIHYDPTQCRSLTVREAARLQTFPDNYFFCGSRTQQYIQVGNAVPPYLAYQIAEIVYKILSKSENNKINEQTIKRKTKLEYVPH